MSGGARDVVFADILWLDHPTPVTGDTCLRFGRLALLSPLHLTLPQSPPRHVLFSSLRCLVCLF